MCGAVAPQCLCVSSRLAQSCSPGTFSSCALPEGESHSAFTVRTELQDSNATRVCEEGDDILRSAVRVDKVMVTFLGSMSFSQDEISLFLHGFPMMLSSGRCPSLWSSSGMSGLGPDAVLTADRREETQSINCQCELNLNPQKI